jgi:hypothetical protein
MNGNSGPTPMTVTDLLRLVGTWTETVYFQSGATTVTSNQFSFTVNAPWINYSISSNSLHLGQNFTISVQSNVYNQPFDMYVDNALEQSGYGATDSQGNALIPLTVPINDTYLVGPTWAEYVVFDFLDGTVSSNTISFTVSN